MTTQTSTRASASERPLALTIRGVSKAFPGLLALDQVDLNIRQGEVHGLCGGNGSGKSTLVKILTGVVSADSGTILVDSREIDAGAMTPKLARELGIRVVHQDYALFPDLSVAENIALGAAYPTAPLGNIQWREVRNRAKTQIERFEIAARPGTLVRDLPVATRAQVAIARALQDVNAGEGLLILDESTAALPMHEVHILLKAVRSLAEKGHSVLFVSHRLDEVVATTQHVTVFRDGRVFSESRTDELTESELIEAIIGRRATAQSSNFRQVRVKVGATSPMLKVESLEAGLLHDINLEVMPGEIVGIAGLLGSGRSELLHAIYGNIRKTKGSVWVNGMPADFARMDQAIAAGVVLIPEDRVGAAVFADLTVDQNLDIAIAKRYWRLLGFQKAKLLRDDRQLRENFRVRVVSGSVPMRTLSGGNQQKVVLARWLRQKPVLLLLDEPTQGVDVGARADIHALIRGITDAGGAALIVSSDFEELTHVVDRAILFTRGTITGDIPSDGLTAERLMDLVYEKEEVMLKGLEG